VLGAVIALLVSELSVVSLARSELLLESGARGGVVGGDVDCSKADVMPASGSALDFSLLDKQGGGGASRDSKDLAYIAYRPYVTLGSMCGLFVGLVCLLSPLCQVLDIIGVPSSNCVLDVFFVALIVTLTGTAFLMVLSLPPSSSSLSLPLPLSRVDSCVICLDACIQSHVLHLTSPRPRVHCGAKAPSCARQQARSQETRCRHVVGISHLTRGEAHWTGMLLERHAPVCSHGSLWDCAVRRLAVLDRHEFVCSMSASVCVLQKCMRLCAEIV
jgi:hypothetical protein